jgi:type I restriction enzyme M protein
VLFLIEIREFRGRLMVGNVKKLKQPKVKSIEETLWDSANKLRGSVEPAEYKHVVLGLIFLKFVNDKFVNHRQSMIDEGKEKYLEIPDFYGQANVFYLDEVSRWSYLITNAKQSPLCQPE